MRARRFATPRAAMRRRRVGVGFEGISSESLVSTNRNGNPNAVARLIPNVAFRGHPLIQGIKLHRTGLEVEASVDQRTWYELGKLLQQVDYAWEWMAADWLAFGDHKYGDHVYQTAARLFGKAPRTWEDYAYIARNVRISERSEIVPVLSHRPVARFSEQPALQHKLLAIAEQHRLSKTAFETVIELYLNDRPYQHLLPAAATPLSRARMRASKERQGVRKRALAEGGAEWLDYAREQAEGWSELLEELVERAGRAS
jgi:hypothetical protein